MADDLSERQIAALAAVCRAILPEPNSTIEHAATDAAVKRVAELIATLRADEDRRRLAHLLTLLGSPAANLLLSGQPCAIQTADRSSRERLLRSWAGSRIQLRRAGFQALKRLANFAYFCWPANGRSHPVWQAAGYPGPLPTRDYAWKPLPTVPITEDTSMDCDVVVVGSGAGGGVVAGVLAEAGLSAVVLDKGPNPDPRTMSQVEGDMLRQLYLDGGMFMTRSGSMPILAGSCLGGGTVVNYTTSFPLSEATRAEWDRVSGLGLFSSAGFAESLARVLERLNVGADSTLPGLRDRMLERGLRSLGWHCGTIQRNVTACPDAVECGYCGYGCRPGAKNDTSRTYLRDAALAGARLVPLCEVDRVTIERGRATGITGTVLGADQERHRITVGARAVVVACGAAQTPALLMRSRLSSPAIGRNLRLHPSTAVVGIFAERIDPWTGFLQTRYSDQFADIEGGYGAKFETVPIHYALPASGFGWESGTQARQDFERLGHTSIVGVLLRDRDSGRVTVSRDGMPQVHYELSAYDVGHLRTALLGAARVLQAAGARELVSLHTPPVRVDPRRQYSIEEFMSAMDARGYRHCRMSYVSFHQMASAAMGSDPKKSVVDETGQTHEVQGLYVADASAFPTSSGVNPMITIMAVADHVARSIIDAW